MNDRNLLVALLALLEREGAVSIPQAARLLGKTEDEVWDALEMLVFCYDAVSVRLDLHEAHAVLESGDTDRLLRLNAEETAILLDALQAQGFSPESELCQKLLRTKGFLSAGGGNSAPRASVQSSGTGDAPEVLERVAAACDDPCRHLLAIDYQKDGAPAPETRTVEPLALAARGDHRYLHAWDRDAGDWRSFRTDRIKDARVLGETFELRWDAPASWNPPAGRDAMARVLFRAGTALPAWHGLTRARAREDGSAEARIPWYGGMWLPKHIVGMAGDAVPLEPPELVEATRAYAQKLLETIS